MGGLKPLTIAEFRRGLVISTLNHEIVRHLQAVGPHSQKHSFTLHWVSAEASWEIEWLGDTITLENNAN